MKRIKIERSILMATLMVLLIGYHGFAQRGPERGQGFRDGSGPGHEMMREGWLENYLDLTDDQKDKIEKLHLDFQKETLQKRNEIDEKRARLHTLMTTENVNKSEVNQLIDEMGAIRTGIQKARMNTHLKVREELTEEQRVKFDAGFHRFSGRGSRHHRFQGMHGRGWN